MAVILRVRTTMTYGSGGPGLSTSYWLPGTTGGVTADASDCVARVRAFWDAIKVNFASSMSLQVQSDVAAIEATTGVLTGLFSATPAAAVVGTGGGNNEVTAAMALIRSRTNSVINGRLLRGRWYLGPVATGCSNLIGSLATATITSFNTGAAGLLAAGATGSVPAVWHRPTTLAAGTHGVVTSFSTWDQYAVLRSRRDA